MKTFSDKLLLLIIALSAIALLLTFVDEQKTKDRAVQIEREKTEQQKQYNTCLFKLMANGIDIQIIEKQDMCVKPMELKPPVSASIQR